MLAASFLGDLAGNLFRLAKLLVSFLDLLAGNVLLLERHRLLGNMHLLHGLLVHDGLLHHGLIHLLGPHVGLLLHHLCLLEHGQFALHLSDHHVARVALSLRDHLHRHLVVEGHHVLLRLVELGGRVHLLGLGVLHLHLLRNGSLLLVLRGHSVLLDKARVRLLEAFLVLQVIRSLVHKFRVIGLGVLVGAVSSGVLH